MIGKYNKILTIVTKYIQTQYIISHKKKSFPGMDLLLKYDKKREYFSSSLTSQGATIQDIVL